VHIYNKSIQLKYIIISFHYYIYEYLYEIYYKSNVKICQYILNLYLNDQKNINNEMYNIFLSIIHIRLSNI